MAASSSLETGAQSARYSPERAARARSAISVRSRCLPGGLARRTAGFAAVRDLSGPPFYRLGAAFTEFHVHGCRRSRPEGGPRRSVWLVRDTGYMPGRP